MESVPADRPALIREALRLESLTVGWMLIEAAVALGTGIAARSLTLIAFGADSVIELLSACVLLWRLNVELRRGEKFSDETERRAANIAGALLIGLTAYVVISSGWSFWRGEGQDFSLVGLVLGVLAIPTMYVLAKAKGRLAAQLGSGALRADAAESVACGYLSAIVVVGLTAQWLIGAWWIDGVSALALVPFLIGEAKEAWEAE